MRRVIGILLVLAMLCAALTLMGCEVSNENIEMSKEDAYIKIWTDTETGVQYVIYHYAIGYAGAGGITVRVDAEGRPMVAQTEVGDDGR